MVAVADLNGDGIKDLAVSEMVSGQWSVAVKLGNKDGSYQPENYVYDSSVALKILMAGRYDGDTEPDLLTGYSLDGSDFDTRLASLSNVTTGGHFPGCAPPKAAKGIAV